MALILRFSNKEKGNFNSQNCMLSSNKGRSSTRGLSVALKKLSVWTSNISKYTK
jgi:hypothetical protein